MATRNKLWANIDWVTFFVFLLLALLGWINIYAAVYDDSHKSILDVSQRYGKQLIWIMAALVLGFTILIIESNFYVFFAWFFYGLTILMLVLVLFAGVEINGSRSWFIIGDFQIQPSEFAKFSTALAVAKLMSGYNFRFTSPGALVRVVGVILLPAMLILMQPDTGSAIVFGSFLLVLYREGLSGVVLFFAALTVLLFLLALLVPNYILLIILFVGGLVAHYILNQRFRVVSIALGVTAGGILLAWLLNLITGAALAPEVVVLGGMVPALGWILFKVAHLRMKRTMVVILVFISSVAFTYSVDFVFNNLLEQHHRDRINELLGIQSDPLGAGYNVNQSKIAIGSGGFLGKGFLRGTQTKYNFVPEQSTDFIFCTVGEEWGFLGSAVVIFLFVFLFIRLIILAERQRSAFSRIYGYSVATILFFHFMVNIGMTIGLMPVIGIPLPFFSYGGSSLWAFTVLLFIFLRLDASRLDKLV
jgi:rod shape determining protein RodA